MIYPRYRKISVNDYNILFPKPPIFLAPSQQITSSPPQSPIAKHTKIFGIHGGFIPRLSDIGIQPLLKVVLPQGVGVLYPVQKILKLHLPIWRCCLSHMLERLFNACQSLNSVHALLMRVPIGRSSYIHPFSTHRTWVVSRGSPVPRGRSTSLVRAKSDCVFGLPDAPQGSIFRERQRISCVLYRLRQWMYRVFDRSGPKGVLRYRRGKYRLSHLRTGTAFRSDLLQIDGQTAISPINASQCPSKLSRDSFCLLRSSKIFTLETSNYYNLKVLPTHCRRKLECK